MKKENMTVYEIAKKAGVSIATVSRAMNEETRAKVLPATLKKIDAIAKRYQYTPSIAAKSLTRAKYETIGVLFLHTATVIRKRNTLFLQKIHSFRDAAANVHG